MKLAAFPKCFMDQLAVQRTMSLFDWIEMASDLPVDGLELYSGFFEQFDDGYLEKVRAALDQRNLAMPMFCCSPDFTQPDPECRRREIAREKRMIEVTGLLDGRFCRVLSGQRRPGISREQGMGWVVESLRELIDFAAEKNVVLALENHYKDNYWHFPEFAQSLDVYLGILDQVDTPWLGAQFDPSNAFLAGEDPVGWLERVKKRVVTVHASDRYLTAGHSLEELHRGEGSPGYASILRHGVVGEGLTDYPRIFRILRETGYNGWVSIEDGLGGLEEIRASAAFLRPLMEDSGNARSASPRQ